MKVIQRAWRNSRGKAFSKRLMPKACELVYDKKERQRDSVLRNYKGDYISMKQHKVISPGFDLICSDTIASLDVEEHPLEVQRRARVLRR